VFHGSTARQKRSANFATFVACIKRGFMSSMPEPLAGTRRNRIARVLGAFAAAAVLSVVGRAVAQTPPTGVVLGIERAFGLELASQTSDAGGTEVTQSMTTVGLGLNGGATSFSTARLGMDYVMDSGLSLGAGLGFANYSTSIETDAGSQDGPSLTRLVFAPRVGYVAMFSDAIGLWPRGGITYASQSSEFTSTNPLTGASMTTESSASDVALTLEAPLVIMPAKSFGFMIAPTFDLGLSHSQEQNGMESDGDVSVSSLGIQFGVFGVL
jgi:hypothetical protein